jgi:hypothetical protein
MHPPSSHAFTLLSFIHTPPIKCVGNCTPAKAQYPSADSECAELDKQPNGKCYANGCKSDCYPTESYQNNFIAIRNMKGSKLGDTLYAEFEDGYKVRVNGSLRMYAKQTAPDRYV